MTILTVTRGSGTQSISEQRYYGAIVEHFKEVWDSEDGVRHAEGVQYWDDKCPDANLDRKSSAGSQRKRLKFDLTTREAIYLLGRFKSVPGYADSLLGHRLEKREARKLDYPWQIRASGVLGRRLSHARALSAAGMGLSMIYARLMHLERNEKEEADEVWSGFLAWRRRTGDVVANWDLKDLLILLQQAGYQRARADTAFLAQAQPLLVGQGSSSPREVSNLVRERELKRRSKKCRLCRQPAHKRYVKQWKPPDLMGRTHFFNYRNDIGNTVVEEILAGLKSAHA